MTTGSRCTRRKKVQHSRRGHRQRRLARQGRRRGPRRRPAPWPAPGGRGADRLVQAFRAAFTRPTSERFALLLLAAIRTTGGRSVLNLLRTVAALAPGHPCSYHRVCSRRRYALWRLGRALAAAILQRWVPSGTVAVAGDDTGAEPNGPKVSGQGCHRDPGRSTHASTA